TSSISITTSESSSVQDFEPFLPEVKDININTSNIHNIGQLPDGNIHDQKL
ncbi:28351_t:CDS:2, partial [Dentiscutata erythropus]